MLLAVGGALGWRRYRSRGLVDPISNLPNLNALRPTAGHIRRSIAARIINYEEIVATLPPNSDASLSNKSSRG